MATKKIEPFAVLSVLFLITIAATKLAGEPGNLMEPSVNAVLPDSVGDWTGRAVLYCHNNTCLAVYSSREDESPPDCPKCGAELYEISLAEQNILPPGTTLLKKEYRHNKYGTILVSLVITGRERSGIHKPQWCLAAQGYAIVSSNVESVSIRNRRPLKIMTHDLIRTVSTVDRPTHTTASSYSYWFAGNQRETPYNLCRILWSAYDNIFRGVTQKWAYFSIMMPRDPASSKHLEAMDDFVSALQPLVAE